MRVKRATFFNRSLGSSQACSQQTVWRAGNIVQADLMAELDGFRLAAVLTAYADLDVRSRCAALGNSTTYKLSDTVLIEHGKRILLEDSSLHVCRQELVDVVT